MTTATHSVTVPVRHVKVKADVQVEIHPFYDGYAMEADVRIVGVDRAWSGGKQVGKGSEIFRMIEENARGIELDLVDLEMVD